MMNLIPYSRRNNDAALYNPFQMFDEMEKRFFGSNSLSEFKTDIRDEGGHYLLEADLPGFKKEDINIDLNDSLLTITAARHSDYERSYGSYSRSFGVEGIETDAIKAAYQDGVLKLTLPKRSPAKGESRRLAIE